MVEVVEAPEIFSTDLEVIKAVAGSKHLPADGDELYMLGEIMDAYNAGLVTDRALYVKATAMAGAYIAQRLSEDIHWVSGQSGAIADITEQLRDEVLGTSEPEKLQ